MLTHGILFAFILWRPVTGIFMQPKQYIKRVCIVGGGVAGVSLAVAMQHLQIPNLEKVILLEARDKCRQSSLGGGIQISSGATVLGRVNLLNDLISVATPLKSIRCESASGETLYNINVPKLMLAFNSSTQVYTVMRDALLALLYNRLFSNNLLHETHEANATSVQVIENCKVLEVIEEADEHCGVVRLDNGTQLAFDLVVGADGVKSVVRQSVIGEVAKQYPTLNKVSSFLEQFLRKAIFNKNLRISYAILPNFLGTKTFDQKREELLQVMGDGVYALRANYGGVNKANFDMVAAVYNSDEGANNPNLDWNELEACQQPGPKTKNLNSNFTLNLLSTGKIYRPSLTSLLQFTNDNADSGNRCQARYFDVEVTKFNLPLLRWYSNRGHLILVGDSAHPMSPFFGQGANQALQDSFTLADLIKQHNIDNKEIDLLWIGKALQAKRKLSVDILSLKSLILGYIETLSSPLGVSIKETFFRIMSGVGILQSEYVNVCRCKIEL